MKSKPVTKEKLVELFRDGATRKLEEHELFVMHAIENPDRAEIYSELQKFVKTDWRYYDLALHYYSEDFAYFEDGQNEDLLVLTEENELSPKLYAEYLRDGLAVVVEGPAVVGGAVAALPPGADLVQRQPFPASVYEGLDEPDVFVDEFGYHQLILL